MDIPTDWTFNRHDIAAGFDHHVREQLPWYDLATGAVAHIVRHYLPEGGLIYDIGASTGNIGKALATTITSRTASLIALEKSPEMAARYAGPGVCQVADATAYDFEWCDIVICFLVLMFIPPAKRKAMVKAMADKLKPGGAMIIVDKVEYQDGYLSSVMHRLTIAGKVATGADPGEIIAKELSLAGAQRPLPTWFVQNIPLRMVEVFRFGEFAGWIGVKPE